MLLRTPNLKKATPNNKGQILVEYLLLLVIAIACATLITKGLVGRGDDANRGIIVKQWDKIIRILGNDVPDCAKQKDFKTANCPP
ncbi:MAG: hypothetical protein H7256_07630 [Bdellovibrio sp.]|nr:hypothetical protein [Bdellovibrio sp.]